MVYIVCIIFVLDAQNADLLSWTEERIAFVRVKVRALRIATETERARMQFHVSRLSFWYLQGCTHYALLCWRSIERGLLFVIQSRTKVISRLFSLNNCFPARNKFRLKKYKSLWRNKNVVNVLLLHFNECEKLTMLVLLYTSILRILSLLI